MRYVVSYTFSLSLLCSITTATIVKSNAAEPIVFESGLLKLIDGSVVFNGTTVTMIQRYRKQVHDFMNQLYTIMDRKLTLVECARLEQLDELPEQAYSTLKQLIGDFEAFSGPFLETIKTARPVLVELIKEFCTRRNRQDSFLLTLIACSNGEEKAVFKKDITSYNLLCDFCIDLMHFLKDLLNSCPKAYADYKRYNDIAKQVHTILGERNISLRREAYRSLIMSISKEYDVHEEVVRAKTESLLNTYLKTYTT